MLNDLTITISPFIGGSWKATTRGKTRYFEKYKDAVAWVESEREKEESEVNNEQKS